MAHEPCISRPGQEVEMEQVAALKVMRDGVADYDESGHDGLADDMREAMAAVADLAAFADSALAYVDAAAEAERQRHRANGAPNSQVVAQTVADSLRAALAKVQR